MKYKWKDKVRIKSKKELECISEVTDDMLKNGGAIMTIACLVEDADGYIMKEDGDFHFLWSDEMIEGLVEEETKPEPKFKVGDSVEVLKSGNVYTISQIKFNGKEFVYTLSNNGSTVSCFSEEEIEFTEEDKYWCDIMSESDPTTYVLPQGYQFVDENGNVINATKIVMEKKKKEYPKTYEECAKVLLERASVRNDLGYKGELLVALQRLLVCRNAYWKIAGEEMGLGKPWRSDWENSEERRYSIVNIESDINLPEKTLTKWILKVTNKILVFPTEKMRDAFYENFKEEIEICKELL